MGKEKLINCKSCGKKIAKDAKVCPECGGKNKKPFYKTAWFWIIAILITIIFATSFNDKNSSNAENKYEKNNGVKVTVVDFSSMMGTEISTWCDNNKINCSIETEYSDTILENDFVSQSVLADAIISEGEKITIVFSLGKEPPTEYKNALKKALSYSDTMSMSKQGIYDQLVSEYGENFEADAAQYAIDHVEANWNANALVKAESYANTMNMSKQSIYDQLISEYGEKFTKEQAQYAVDNVEADWDANALAKAISYRDTMSMSKNAIYSQLISEYGEQFTKEQAQYAIDHLED